MAEYRRLWIGGREQTAYGFHLRLSHSRYGVVVWSERKTQLSWHHVHNEAFRRIEGVPATVRVDNKKTAMARGAGPWGELNPSYRRYALAVRFHIDPCLPRAPRHKGKVERGIRDARFSFDPTELLRRRADPKNSAPEPSRNLLRNTNSGLGIINYERDSG